MRRAIGVVFLSFEIVIEKNKNIPMTTAIRKREVQESNDGVACMFICLKLQ